MATLSQSPCTYMHAPTDEEKFSPLQLTVMQQNHQKKNTKLTITKFNKNTIPLHNPKISVNPFLLLPTIMPFNLIF